MSQPTMFAEPDSQATRDVPWTLDLAIQTFLHRWMFNWRGEHDVMASELRQLVADAMLATRERE